MKDLYAHLHVDESASTLAIAQVIPSADAALQEAARFILLDARRRAVYDRHRKLLGTIGELRAHLGLNFTRFWARGQFKDFWKELSPAQPQPRARRRVDPMLIAQALIAGGKHARKHAARGGAWAWAVIAALLAFLLIVAWRHWM